MTEGLHIYGPVSEHDDAYIVGTRDDLIRLRDSLGHAISCFTGPTSSTDHFQADGEGYKTFVIKVPDIGGVVTSYSETYGPPASGMNPHDLIRQPGDRT